MHNYGLDHIWNFNETSIQVGKRVIISILAKQGSQQMYNTIPKAKEWLTINYVVNAIRTTLLGFFIFKGKKI
jgi:hypothetical protein